MKQECRVVVRIFLQDLGGELVARIKVHVVKMVISADDVKICTQGLQWHLCLCVREVSLLCPPQLLLIEKAYHLLLLN